MSALDAAMMDVLEARPDVQALACMDGAAGLLLGVYVRDEVPRELVELAACSAPDLCGPTAGERASVEGGGASEGVVVEGDWVHAFARVPNRPGLVVMGLAARGADVARLCSWLGEVAGRFGALA